MTPWLKITRTINGKTVLHLNYTRCGIHFLKKGPSSYFKTSYWPYKTDTLVLNYKKKPSSRCHNCGRWKINLLNNMASCLSDHFKCLKTLEFIKMIKLFNKNPLEGQTG
ncbi:Protein of unknown function [Cotesia congregata]|uniref:Uncharacterized protein n=1 Tax=Cotesia congregata TaxID=51543 RepID=A0A8J2HAQ6_COTCN|nr:Protein of unknown function [Cotesia congregata]